MGVRSKADGAAMRASHALDGRGAADRPSDRALSMEEFQAADAVAAKVAVAGIAADRLKSIVERVERLNEERKALASDISDIFAEAKGAGFDVKAVRQVIRARTWEPAALEQHEALIDLYRRALGM